MRSPLQGKHCEKSKLEVKAGARKSTNVSKTAEIHQEVTDKRGKQKVSLLAAALGNPSLCNRQLLPHGRKKPKGNYAITNVPSVERSALEERVPSSQGNCKSKRAREFKSST